MINTYTIKLSAEQKHFVIEGLYAVLEHTTLITARQRNDLRQLIQTLQTQIPDSGRAMFVTPTINRTEDGEILEA